MLAVDFGQGDAVYIDLLPGRQDGCLDVAAVGCQLVHVALGVHYESSLVVSRVFWYLLDALVVHRVK